MSVGVCGKPGARKVASVGPQVVVQEQQPVAQQPVEQQPAEAEGEAQEQKQVAEKQEKQLELNKVISADEALKTKITVWLKQAGWNNYDDEDIDHLFKKVIDATETKRENGKRFFRKNPEKLYKTVKGYFVTDEIISDVCVTYIATERYQYKALENVLAQERQSHIDFAQSCAHMEKELNLLRYPMLSTVIRRSLGRQVTEELLRQVIKTAAWLVQKQGTLGRENDSILYTQVCTRMDENQSLGIEHVNITKADIIQACNQFLTKK